MNRRDFLRTVGAVPLVIVAAKTQALWLPDREIETRAPKDLIVMRDAIYDGQTIGGYFVKPHVGDVRTLLARDAADHFLPGCPIVVFATDGQFQRFIFRGSRDALAHGQPRQLLETWQCGATF